jgi:hypothetical protein
VSPWFIAALVLFACLLFWLVVHVTLNQGPDRIQLATLCLFFCVLVYCVGAMRVVQGGTSLAAVGVVGYIGLVYVAMGFLAVCLYRWAWLVVVGAFGIHLLLALALAAPALAAGPASAVGLVQWVALGAVGLLACLHPGSRSVLVHGRASSAP